MVTRQKELPLPRVPDGERKLPVDKLEHVGTELLIKVEEHLDVAAGEKAVAEVAEALAQLDIVEDFPVADQPESAVLVGDGL